jgi:hypothetical protein
MGKVTWEGSSRSQEEIGEPVSFITGANLRKRRRPKPARTTAKRQRPKKTRTKKKTRKQ